LRLRDTIGFALILGGLILGVGHLPGRFAALAGDSEETPPKFVVIVHPDNPIERIDLANLRRLFLRQAVEWKNGWKVSPYNLHSSDEVRNDFSLRVLGKTPREMADYWLQVRLTRGVRPPKVCGSARLMKSFVSRTRGGIGYVTPAELDETVKAIEVAGLE